MHFLGQFDLAHWVSVIGYVGVLCIILCETGLFFGFFLPGDSLVFTAGVLAARGVFHLALLLPLLIIAAFLGYQLGYWFGRRLGHWLLRRKDSFWFKQDYIAQAHAFYARHGGQAMVLCRLIPVVRTFCPIVAGMAEMPLKRYVAFNLIGGMIWAGGVTLLGYTLGDVLPQSQKLILPIVLLIIVVSVLPGVYHYWKTRRATTVA